MRDYILLEKIAPGMPVGERELAAALGISRTPLREAMHQLEMEGLVEYSTTRRPYVANPSLETLAKNFSVLGVLEALAGEQACEFAPDAVIDDIVILCDKMIETSDSSAALDFFRLDMDFHHSIVMAAGNQPLIRTHQQYTARLWRARFISSRSRPNRPRTLHEHRDITQALQARDATSCALALRTHLETTIGNIEKTLPESQDKEIQ